MLLTVMPAKSVGNLEPVSTSMAVPPVPSALPAPVAKVTAKPSAEKPVVSSSPTNTTAAKKKAPTATLAKSLKKGKKKQTRSFWSDEEHQLFLTGLQVHGRGSWRLISKDFVRTRTPSQVASHAQKFFLRQARQAQAQSTNNGNFTSRFQGEGRFDIRSPAVLNFQNRYQPQFYLPPSNLYNPLVPQGSGFLPLGSQGWYGSPYSNMVGQPHLGNPLTPSTVPPVPSGTHQSSAQFGPPSVSQPGTAAPSLTHTSAIDTSSFLLNSTSAMTGSSSTGFRSTYNNKPSAVSAPMPGIPSSALPFTHSLAPLQDPASSLLNFMPTSSATTDPSAASVTQAQTSQRGIPGITAYDPTSLRPTTYDQSNGTTSS